MSTARHEPFTLSLPDRIREQCRPYMDREALRFRGLSWSYGNILDAAQALAARLRALELPRGEHVACLVDRGPSALVAFLGVLQSGGVLLPLDDSAPDARLADILSQAAVRFGVASRSQLPRVQTLAGPSGSWLPLDGIGPKVSARVDETGDAPSMTLADPAYTIFTSGSTGHPKGVQISHGALLHSVVEGTPAIRMCPGDRVAQLAPLAFDAAVWEHLAPLYAGATVVPIPSEDLASPEGFVDLVARERISWSYLPPSLFAEWVSWAEQTGVERAQQALGTLRVLLFAGDVLPAPLVRRWQAIMGTNITLMNFYGPTETTVLVCGYVVDGLWPRDHDTIPMGRPFGANRLLVLDDALLPCPPGVVGDIYLGGPQLALGYLHQPALTQAAFLADPFETGGRLYDTRDRGYWDADGNVVFAGRRDRQVKLRGKRLELEEVEAHLLRLPGVRQAVALITGCDTDKRLVACVVGHELEALSLRHALSQRLPDYMVPHHVWVLDGLPLSSTGKVDRGALVNLLPAEAPTQRIRDPLEAIWVQVLGQAPATESVTFMEAGGDSLVLLRALMLAQRAGFRCQDLLALHRDNSLAGWRRHLVWEGGAAVQAERPTLFPLAPIQREMFALRASHPNRQLYVIQFVFRAAPLDVGLLERAFQTVIRHHPMLRCVREGEQQRVLHSDVASRFRVERAVITSLEAWKAEDLLRPFDPCQFPLFRATWLEEEGGQYLGVTFFHTVVDGWSFSHLILQTCAAYRSLVAGREPALRERRCEFYDYVAHIERLAGDPTLEAERHWWDERLTGSLPLARLPMDGPGGRLKREAFWFSASRAVSERVRRRAAQLRVTVHRVLLAAYFRLIHRITGQRQLMLGNTVAGRPWELADIDQVLGCTIDIQPVVVPDAGDTFPALVEAVGRDLDSLAAHTRLPGSFHLLRLKGAELEQGFCWKVIFAFDNFPEAFGTDELIWPPHSWNPIEPYELALSVVDLEGTLSCYWNYRADLVTETWARGVAQSYLEILGDHLHES